MSAIAIHQDSTAPTFHGGALTFDAGSTIGALAVQMERTRGAITARLVKLGKIEAPPGLRLRGEGAAGEASRMTG